jgi:hypothetical protein
LLQSCPRRLAASHGSRRASRWDPAARLRPASPSAIGRSRSRPRAPMAAASPEPPLKVVRRRPTDNRARLDAHAADHRGARQPSGREGDQEVRLRIEALNDVRPHTRDVGIAGRADATLAPRRLYCLATSDYPWRRIRRWAPAGRSIRFATAGCCRPINSHQTWQPTRCRCTPCDVSSNHLILCGSNAPLLCTRDNA